LSEVDIPASQLVDVSSLKTDKNNPNFMGRSQLEALERSIKRWGFLVPIITNKDLLVADGEQRLSIAKKLGMLRVPTIRLPVSEVDRKLIRQVMNKIRGEHIEHLDAEEFKFILERSEKGREELGKMLLLRDSQINAILKKEPKKEGAEKKAVEDSRTFVKCPKCQYVFDPTQHKAMSLLDKVTSEKLQFQEIPGDTLNKDYNVLVNVAFDTKQPDVTERVVVVAQGFGLGIDETRTFHVFHDFTFRFSKGDITYVTGDSGSGKTVFLNDLRSFCVRKGLTVASLDQMDIQPSERVIEGLGADIKEAMSLLSAVGLSEAFIMLAEYGNLSDGQRYRYRLAKLLSRRTDVVFIDEFCATLDRSMAKVISYNLQRYVRNARQTAFIASTRQDLVNDLDPDILLIKRFGDGVQLEYADPARQPRQFSLTRDLRTQECSQKDIQELLAFHYLGHEIAAASHTYKMLLDDELVGAVVYSKPQTLQSRLRQKYFPEYRDMDSELARRINAEVLRLSRIVINPKYRGVGLAQKLIEETLPLLNVKLVETVAAMAKHNPFFEKAGFRNFGVLNGTEAQDQLREKITSLGGKPELMFSLREAQRFAETLTPEQREELSSMVYRVISSRFSEGTEYGKTQLLKTVKAATTSGLAPIIRQALATERVYLVWENPNWPPKSMGTIEEKLQS
jgi:ABC-type lipoprotein export system ATPase subunit/predicted GNAT family N-acyltransferase